MCTHGKFFTSIDSVIHHDDDKMCRTPKKERQEAWLSAQKAKQLAKKEATELRKSKGLPTMYVWYPRPSTLLPVPSHKMHRLNLTPSALKPMLAKVRAALHGLL